MEQLKALIKSQGQGGQQPIDKYKTPPPRVGPSSPSTKPDPKVKPRKLDQQQGDTAAGPPKEKTKPIAEPSEELTEEARLQRLRRLCEVKPSGRCHVTPEIHQRWKTGTKSERLALVSELEKSGWSKDAHHVLVSRVDPLTC